MLKSFSRDLTFYADDCSIRSNNEKSVEDHKFLGEVSPAPFNTFYWIFRRGTCELPKIINDKMLG